MVPFRYEVAPAGQTHAFKPDVLTPERLGDERLVRHTELGAVFSGSFGSLPNENAQVVWECELDTAPPATIRAKKPKVWIKSAFSLDADKVYSLT